MKNVVKPELRARLPLGLLQEEGGEEEQAAECNRVEGVRDVRRAKDPVRHQADVEERMGLTLLDADEQGERRDPDQAGRDHGRAAPAAERSLADGVEQGGEPAAGEHEAGHVESTA